MSGLGWYRSAVIYSLDVAAFQDSDGDGIGDFRGLTQRLDYLAGLGVDALWLLPFYPSPQDDDGYDVADYYGIREPLGDLGDFVDFIRAAGERGLRVLVDLVVQHTSREHPWFRRSRSQPDSPFRSYYLWRDEPPEHPDVQPIFPGHQDGVWAHDAEAGAYYRHRFYAAEPDLNIADGEVRDQIRKVAQFWTRLGVSGLRIDAAPYIVESAAAADPRDGGHWFLRELRDFANRQGDQIALMGETDVAPEQYEDFFGGGDELHLLLNFFANNYTFLALARQDARPLVAALERMPEPPRSGQYAYWLRNHDELDLGRLGDDEREQVFAAFAPDPDMRLYDRGIRRRLAPILGGDPAREAMAHSLLFSLGGTTVLRYGQELGMGEDLSLPERQGIRTAMQWSGDRHGGFTAADKPCIPVISEGPYGFPNRNVVAQQLRPDSLLNRVERMISVRRQAPELGQGRRRFLDVGCPAVLAVAHEWDGMAFLALTNLSGDEHRVRLPDRQRYAFLADVLGDRQYEELGPDTDELRLGAYGYRWLRGRMGSEGDR